MIARRHRFVLLTVGCFVVLRLAYLGAYGWAAGWEENGLPVSDARGYDAVATKILEGKGYVAVKDGFVLQAYAVPLYPIFLALIYSLFGHSYVAVKIVQQGLGLGSCLFLYGVASRLFNRRAGLIAAGLFAGYPAYAAYSVSLMTETVFLFLLAGALFSLVHMAASSSLWKAALGGFITGSAILTRPAGTSLVLGALALLLCGQRPVRWRPLCVYLAVVALTLSPWLVRNYALTGGIYVAEVGPRQFWTGSHPRFHGFAYSREAWSELLWRDPDATELERSKRMLREAVGFVMEDPRRYLRFAVGRYHRFWEAIPDVPVPAAAGALGVGLAWLLSTVQRLVIPLGALGLVRAIAHRRVTVLLGVPMLGAIIFHALFGAGHRYRLPFDVIFMVYAGYLVTLLIDLRCVEWRDFSVLCRRDPPAIGSGRSTHGAWGRLGRSCALAVAIPLLAFIGRAALVSDRPVADCRLSPDEARDRGARLQGLGPAADGRPMTWPTYRDVWAERTRNGGRVGVFDGVPVVWGGQVRYPVRDAAGRVREFDLYLNVGPDKVEDDVIAVTLPESPMELREGRCVTIAGLVQERRVGHDPFARPVIRPVAFLGPGGEPSWITGRMRPLLPGLP